MHSFLKCLFLDKPTNFYWNRFIFDRNRAKNKLACFLRHRVYTAVSERDNCTQQNISQHVYTLLSSELVTECQTNKFNNVTSLTISPLISDSKAHITVTDTSDTHTRFHGLRYSLPSKVLLYVKTQKYHKIFSELSATLIIQLKMCWTGPPSCCDCC